MRQVWFVALGLTVGLAAAAPVGAQSLYVEHGYRGAEAGIGWSVGPSSNGVEAIFGVSVDGRTDVGIWISRYTVDLGGGLESSWREYAPFVKYFAVEEENGAPVSVSLDAQLFLADYATDDSGRYIQLGPTVYKAFRLSDRVSLYPFAGFKFVAESYSFGGGDNETAQYLTREFGLHFTTPINDRWFIQGTVDERSFRRETYRAARIAVVGRL